MLSTKTPINLTMQRAVSPLQMCMWMIERSSLAEASTYIEVIEKRQGLKVACLEGIAYRNGWISEEKMRELAKPMLKNQYGQYLLA